jgi:protein-disulfide isomerase
MQGDFHPLSFSISRMPQTSTTKPLALIVGAIVIAAGIAVYLSRDASSTETQPSGAVATSAPIASTGGGRIRGAADAKVTIVEYGDFQCPTCAQYHPIMTELLRRYDGQLKLEFHHFPLIQIHPNAMGAAVAAEAAGDQGKFWEMHDLLFEHQTQWSSNPNAQTLFLQYALQLGLDSNRFQQSTKDPATQDRVLADVTKGSAIVQGTPTFIVNGELITNLPNLQQFSELVERRLTPAAK